MPFAKLSSASPVAPRASYVHWKAAWLTLRQGRNDEAKKAFEEQIAMYPSGSGDSAALYWRARLAEEDNQPANGSRLLSEAFRSLSQLLLRRTGPRAHEAPSCGRRRYDNLLPARSRPAARHSDVKVHDSEPPADELHVQKAELLGNGGLVDFAVRELQAAAAADGGSWGPAETAQLYVETGHYDRAIEFMKHSAPNYFALDIPDLAAKVLGSALSQGLLDRPETRSRPPTGSIPIWWRR